MKAKQRILIGHLETGIYVISSLVEGSSMLRLRYLSCECLERVSIGVPVIPEKGA